VTQLPINKTTLDPAKREALRGNNDVALVQILCNGLLKSGLAIDKDYGPATQAAATTYQQISGVPADGVIGPVSWTAFLNSDGA
jgi:peptidoglycan hydrolase-like protein with peptidoglycan-binding domain